MSFGRGPGPSLRAASRAARSACPHALELARRPGPEPPSPTSLQGLLARFGELLHDARLEGARTHETFVSIAINAIAVEAVNPHGKEIV